MGVRFLGQYLLENRVITPEQLLGALAHQEKTNRKFGETAVSLGLLTEDQLGEVLALQRSEDVRTGEAAVRLGFLNAVHVDRVLRAQRNSHILIGEALVVTGAIDRDDLEEHVVRFQAEQDALKVTEQAPPGLDPSGLGAPAVDLVAKFLLRVADTQVKVAGWSSGALPARGDGALTARISFGGDVVGQVAMRAPRLICVTLAERMAGEHPGEDEEAILDGAREFLNVVAGNLAAAAARLGRKLDIHFPLLDDLPAPGDDEHLLVAELTSTGGPIDVALLTQKG
jgi:hypothetical protein